MKNTKLVQLPHPYPLGSPCGVIGHFVWCRCQTPSKQNGYIPGEEEYDRIKKLNLEYIKKYRNIHLVK